MKEITLEWIEIAEGDWATANREHRVTENPNHKAVCFHCQQCGETYLKAYLQEESIPPPRTHDLNLLLNEILSFEPSWSNLADSCLVLTDFAVDHRYPSRDTTKKDADDAVEHCGTIRSVLRSFFELDDEQST